MLDLFTIKPIDRETVLRCVTATGGKLITVEDHYPEGGIGSAVAEAISDVTGGHGLSNQLFRVIRI